MKKLDKEQLEAVKSFFNISSDLMVEHLKEKGLIEEFEVGKLYRSESGSIAIYQTEDSGYGFNSRDKYESCFHFNVNHLWVLANEEDKKRFETALITEAKKIGFKEGVKITNVINNNTALVLEDGLSYYLSDNRLIIKWDNNGGLSTWTIFNNGKWATIIEEEREFLIQVQKGTIIIEGKEYTAEEIINKFNK